MQPEVKLMFKNISFYITDDLPRKSKERSYSLRALQDWGFPYNTSSKISDNVEEDCLEEIYQWILFQQTSLV